MIKMIKPNEEAYKEQLIDIKTENMKCQTKLKVLSDKVSDMSAKLKTSAPGEMSRRVESLLLSVTNLQDDMSDKLKEIEALKTNHKKCVSDKDAMSMRVDSLKLSVSDKLKELGALKTKHKNCVSDKDAMSMLVDSLRLNVADLQDDMSDQLEELETLKAAVDRAGTKEREKSMDTDEHQTDRYQWM